MNTCKIKVDSNADPKAKSPEVHQFEVQSNGVVIVETANRRMTFTEKQFSERFDIVENAKGEK